MMGHGWYASDYIREPSGPTSLLFQLNIHLQQQQEDQQPYTAFNISSDITWSSGKGPILNDSIYDGEAYDARMEQPNWNQPNFQPSSNNKWNRVQPVQPPGGVLRVQPMEPVKWDRQHNHIKPLSVTNPQKNVYVFDMGQNFAGYCLLKVKGTAGTVVRLR